MDKPKITDQWLVIDRWWTDDQNLRLYCELLIKEQKIVIRFDYNNEMQKYELVGEVNA